MYQLYKFGEKFMSSFYKQHSTITRKKVIEIVDFTTTLSSFTDGLISSVTAMKSVGEKNTDGLTDGTRPSVYQSSVNPISVAKSVANKKKHPPTEHRQSYRRIRARQKKSFPREHYRPNKSVCNFNGNYRWHIRR